MSLIVSLRPPLFGSVSASNERRWMSIRWGTSRGLSRREKLLRVTGAALERAKVGDSSGGQRDVDTAQIRAGALKMRATGENNTRPHADSSLAPWAGLRECRTLGELDRRARLLEFGFEFVGLVALDALFDRFRSLVDERLGLFQAETGRRPDHLDHRDFLSADLFEDDVDGRGLFGPALVAATAAAGSRRSRGRHGRRGNAELLLERFDPLGELEHRDALPPPHPTPPSPFL